MAQAATGNARSLILGVLCGLGVRNSLLTLLAQAKSQRLVTSSATKPGWGRGNRYTPKAGLVLRQTIHVRKKVAGALRLANFAARHFQMRPFGTAELHQSHKAVILDETYPQPTRAVRVNRVCRRV